LCKVADFQLMTDVEDKICFSVEPLPTSGRLMKKLEFSLCLLSVICNK